MDIILIFAAFILGGMVVKIYEQRRYSTLLSHRDLLQSKQQELTSTIDYITPKLDKAVEELNIVRSENVRLSTRLTLLQQNDVEFRQNIKQNQDGMKLFFENIASKILEDKSVKFEQISSKHLQGIITPLGKDLDQFKKKVEELYVSQAKDKSSLSSELKQLMLLNKQLSDDANTLARAIKGEHNPKIQGDWGEMILDTILSNSGLEKGVHYFTQESSRNDDGDIQRPDVVVRYPDSREIIIDSKVSLTAYSRYVNAADDNVMTNALQEHIVSVKRHIDQLSEKRYSQRDNSLDFVMMFMPIEPAYILALGADGNLWEYAYKKKIMLVSPTHLITALKLVYDLWSRDSQTRNAIDIAARGAQMYDKFVGFVSDMQAIDKNIQYTAKAYDNAMNKLSSGKGNLVRQAELLKELGVRANKELSLSSSNNEIHGNIED